MKQCFNATTFLMVAGLLGTLLLVGRTVVSPQSEASAAKPNIPGASECARIMKERIDQERNNRHRIAVNSPKFDPTQIEIASGWTHSRLQGDDGNEDMVLQVAKAQVEKEAQSSLHAVVTLLADAHPITRVRPQDEFAWMDQETVYVTEKDTGSIFRINRRTHRRTYVAHWDGTICRCEPAMPSRPTWLPHGAKIVAYDCMIAPPEARQAWIVAWPVEMSAPQPGCFPSGGTHDADARFGLWVTEPGRTRPRLLGAAPLSRQELRALPRYEDGRFYNTLFLLRDNKEVSFAYRGILYVIPISGKPATI